MKSCNNHYYLPTKQLQDLIALLKSEGYQCIGPQVKDGAIVFDELSDVEQLPWGVSDDQSPGRYRLKESVANKAFSWTTATQSIKPFLFKPREVLWKATRNDQGGFEFIPAQEKEKPIAFIGARPCDIKAVEIQDKVFIENNYQDPLYYERRSTLFLVAVNCVHASMNCFCVSAGGSPHAKENFDLALTELEGGFLVEIGSEKAKKMAAPLQLKKASVSQCDLAECRIEATAKSQTKKLNAGNDGQLRDILFDNLEHPRWSDVAERCLSCGNCTLVCPTCFCSSEDDEANLDGCASCHIREWDSCFTAGHSYMAKKVLRDDTRKRYRQWLTHKLGSWHEQFDLSGCVGCGRCITWCPVGIDITEEANAISEK